MIEPVRARGHEWLFVDGAFCLTVHGEDRQTAVAIPIGALLTLAADGRRRHRALVQQTVAPGATESLESVRLTEGSVLPVQSWNVGSANNGMLLLLLDRGLDTEVIYGLAPDAAEKLAGLLMKYAGDAAKGPPPPGPD
jgi:hypothetical protein